MFLCILPNFKGHDDVIKHFPRHWPFLRGIHQSPVNSPHKGQWRGALMIYLICARIKGWVNNGKAGVLRRHRPSWRHCNEPIVFYPCPNLKWKTGFTCKLWPMRPCAKEWANTPGRQPRELEINTHAVWYFLLPRTYWHRLWTFPNHFYTWRMEIQMWFCTDPQIMANLIISIAVVLHSV